MTDVQAVVERDSAGMSSVISPGDFFFYPGERLADLEKALVDVPVEEAKDTVASFYEQHGIESPGVTPGDIGALLEG